MVTVTSDLRMHFLYIVLLISEAISQVASDPAQARNVRLVDPFRKPNGQKVGQLSSAIIGGQVAGRSEFPWAVLLLMMYGDVTVSCSAALLADQWVLTAAHCISWPPAVNVVLGAYRKFHSSPGEVSLVAKQFYVHEQFGRNLDYDIGLIKLDDRITFTDSISPVALPLKSSNGSEPLNYSGLNSTVIGWGRLSADISDDADELRKLAVTLMDADDCAAAWDDHFTPRMLCSEPTGASGFCMGDSGGPLMHQAEADVVRVIGVASFVALDGDCGVSAPNVYTSTAAVLDWICETMEKYGD